MAQMRIPYPIVGPYMDRSKPTNQLTPGRFGYLAGVDGRYNGCLHHFYGMDEVTDLDLSNVTFFQHVSFQKGTSSTEYRGFVIRSGATLASQSVKFFYDDSGWTSYTIHASGIDSTDRMWCTTNGKFLYVAVEGQTPQSVYYTGSALTKKTMGPSSASAGSRPTRPTFGTTTIDFDSGGTTQIATGDTITGGTSTATAYIEGVKVSSGAWADGDAAGILYLSNIDGTFQNNEAINIGGVDCGTVDGTLDGTDGYYLNGKGTYRIAYRFYDTDRDLYGPLSNPLNYTLGGYTSNENYYINLTLPSIGSGYDRIVVYRTINLGAYGAFEGAIYYKEQTLTSGGANKKIGTLRDEGLVMQDDYDPETDVVVACPQVGAIGTWESITFMARATSTRNGVDTIWSDPGTFSPEYFTDENIYRADMEDGRPLRYVAAGDTLFILHPQAIVYVEKQGTAFKFSRQHIGRGLTAAGAAHTIGNDLIMMTPLGIATIDGRTATMRIFSSLDRQIFEDYEGDLDSIDSCFDAYLNASFFLNPTDKQITCIWWSNKGVSLLEGANFAHCTHGADVDGGLKNRAYFINDYGLIVSPDLDESSSGTMWGLDSSYTLNGTVTSSSGATSLTDSEATYHADMVGAMIYMTSGDDAGEATTISAVDVGNKTLTLDAGLSNDISSGDRYAISPVPFKVRLWRLPSLMPPQNQKTPASQSERKILTSIGLKCQNLSSFTGNDNDQWRISGYRNASSSLAKEGAYITVDSNPADSVEYLNIDGVDVEPYVELISAGAKFELTYCEIGATITVSRKVSD